MEGVSQTRRLVRFSTQPERVWVQLGHPRYNLTFEVNQSYNLIYGGLPPPLFRGSKEKSCIDLLKDFPQWPFWNLPRLRSLWLRCGLSSGLFQVPKDRLPAYARVIYFERTRKPLPDSLRRLLIYFFPSQVRRYFETSQRDPKKKKGLSPPPAPLASIIIDVEGRSVGLTPIEIDNHSNKRLKAVTSHKIGTPERGTPKPRPAKAQRKTDPLEYI